MDEMENHLSDDLASRYASDPDSVRDRAAVEQHLGACAPCSEMVAGFREFIAALRDEETWWLMGEMETQSQHALRELIERCAAEDAVAERMLRPLLASQYRFTYANIVRKRRFHTGGVVRALCRAAWEECAKEPLFALTLAETAAALRRSAAGRVLPQRRRRQPPRHGVEGGIDGAADSGPAGRGIRCAEARGARVSATAGWRAGAGDGGPLPGNSPLGAGAASGRPA